MRSYTVVGLGAVGGLYGGRLLAAGHPVHWLVRSDADVLAARGLRLRSPLGDVTAPLSVHDRPNEVPPTDVVIVALKTTANDALPNLLGPLTREGTIVVVLQNGLGVEAEAAAASHPGTVVLGGLCFVCSHRRGPGEIDHLDYGAVTLAEHRADGSAAGLTGAVEAVAEDLAGGGVDVRPKPDLVEARWRKLMWNVPYNGLSVVLDAGTDELNAEPSTRTLVTDLMQEVRAGAAAQGRDIPESFVQTMLTDTDAMTPYAPSMKLDFDTGRPLEIDAIYRRPIVAARQAGVDLPRITTLERQLSFLTSRQHPQIA